MQQEASNIKLTTGAQRWPLCGHGLSSWVNASMPPAKYFSLSGRGVAHSGALARLCERQRGGRGWPGMAGVPGCRGAVRCGQLWGVLSVLCPLPARLRPHRRAEAIECPVPRSPRSRHLARQGPGCSALPFLGSGHGHLPGAQMLSESIEWMSPSIAGLLQTHLR